MLHSEWTGKILSMCYHTLQDKNDSETEDSTFHGEFLGRFQPMCTFHNLYFSC